MNTLHIGIVEVRALEPGKSFRCQRNIGLLASTVACSIGRTYDGKGYLYMRGYIAGWPIADAWNGRKIMFVKTCKEQGLKRFTSAEQVVAYALAQHAPKETATT